MSKDQERADWITNEALALMDYFMDKDIEATTAQAIMAITLVTLWARPNCGNEENFNSFVAAAKESLAKYKEGIRQ